MQGTPGLPVIYTSDQVGHYTPVKSVVLPASLSAVVIVSTFSFS